MTNVGNFLELVLSAKWPYVGGACVFKTFITFIQRVKGKRRKDVVLGGKMLFNCWDPVIATQSFLWYIHKIN